MRQKLPSPIRPFDLVPSYVVDAAKRIFELAVTSPGATRSAITGTEEWGPTTERACAAATAAGPASGSV